MDPDLTARLAAFGLTVLEKLEACNLELPAVSDLIDTLTSDAADRDLVTLDQHGFVHLAPELTPEFAAA